MTYRAGYRFILREHHSAVTWGIPSRFFDQPFRVVHFDRDGDEDYDEDERGEQIYFCQCELDNVGWYVMTSMMEPIGGPW